MAPKKVIPSPTVAKNILTGIRKSQRVSARLAAIDTNSKRCNQAESQPIKNNRKKRSIPRLNDDCLLEIFSFLPIKCLLYDIGMCSQRFRALAEVAVREKCRAEQFVFNYSDIEATPVVDGFGEMLRNVFVYQRYSENTKNDSLSWLKKCKSLKALKVQNMRLIYDSECFGAFGKLKMLTLDRCYGTSQQYEHIITACKKLKSIELLNWAHGVPDEMLAHLSTLKTIKRITSHHDISTSPLADDHLAKIAQLKRLKYLCFNIGFCEGYGPLINALSASQSLLELVLNVNFIDANVADALDTFPKFKLCRLNYDSWVPKKSVQPITDRLRNDTSELRSQIKKFDVTETISAFAENESFSHIKLSVILERLS